MKRYAALAGTLTALLVATGCGTRLASVGPRSLQTAASISIHVPRGNNPVSNLVGDPNAGGVWFWDETATAVRIFHATTRGLVSWLVLTGASYARPQAQSGLAIGADDHVWFGIDRILVELDPASGRTRKWSIPAPRGNPAADRYFPPDLKTVHAVQGIAVSATGRVAIAMSNSSSVVVFDISSTTFSAAMMPTKADQPLAVAYSSGGILGVALTDFSTHQARQVALVSASGQVVSSNVPDSTQIRAGTPGAFVVGSWRPALLDSSGIAVPLATPHDRLGTTGEPQAPGFLPDDRLAFVTTTGIAEFPLRTSGTPTAMSAATTVLRPPHIRCVRVMAPPVPGGSGNSQGQARCVRPTVQAMAVDGRGHVWIVAPNSPGTVEMLAP